MARTGAKQGRADVPLTLRAEGIACAVLWRQLLLEPSATQGIRAAVENVDARTSVFLSTAVHDPVCSLSAHMTLRLRAAPEARRRLAIGQVAKLERTGFHFEACRPAIEEFFLLEASDSNFYIPVASNMTIPCLLRARA